MEESQLVLVTQLSLTLCDPMDCSLPGPSIHGILQARILERVPSPSPRDLPDPAIELWSSELQADSLQSEQPGKPSLYIYIYEKVKAKSFSHVRLCDPMDCSLPRPSIHGIFQARVL